MIQDHSLFFLLFYFMVRFIVLKELSYVTHVWQSGMYVNWMLIKSGPRTCSTPPVHKHYQLYVLKKIQSMVLNFQNSDWWTYSNKVCCCWRSILFTWLLFLHLCFSSPCPSAEAAWETRLSQSISNMLPNTPWMKNIVCEIWENMLHDATIPTEMGK